MIKIISKTCSLTFLSTFYFLSDIIPRSVLMVKLGEVSYLLCALGDGCLYYYVLDYDLGLWCRLGM